MKLMEIEKAAIKKLLVLPAALNEKDPLYVGFVNINKEATG